MCPYYTETCGPQQNFTLHEEWDRFDVTLAPMARGDVCTYKIKGYCGAPSFKFSNGYINDFMIQYIEFNGDDI